MLFIQHAIMNNLKINLWHPDSKPKEKFTAKGAATLTDDELLAIIIGAGNQTHSAQAIARAILDKADNNLAELARYNITQLQQIHGIGNTKAITIAAALELGRRINSQNIPHKDHILSSADAIAMFHPLLAHLHYEEVWAIFLSPAKKIIDKFRASTGGIDNSPIDMRLIMRRALDANATGLILVHNHPHGNPTPSQYDIEATKQIAQGAAIFNIKLLDHIIITENENLSMAEKGLL